MMQYDLQFELDDLRNWVKENRANIKRHALELVRQDSHNAVQTKDQDKKSTDAAISSPAFADGNHIEKPNKAVTKTHSEHVQKKQRLLDNNLGVQTLKPKLKVKQNTLEDWLKCLEDCSFNNNLLSTVVEACPPNECSTFENEPIVCLRAVYSMKMLPGGGTMGDEKMCQRVNGKMLKKMPTLFPKTKKAFNDTAKCNSHVRQQLATFWFRVAFEDTSKNDVLIHYKDLLKENAKKLHFLELLRTLFKHLCDKNTYGHHFLLEAVKLTLND